MKEKKKIPTSKKLIAFLFTNCTLIELFVAFITWRSLELSTVTLIQPDFTPLITIVGAVVGEVIGYAIYSIKSTKENTKGGITYDLAIRENNENAEG